MRPVLVPFRNARAFSEAMVDIVKVPHVHHVLLGFLDMGANGAAGAAVAVLAGGEFFEHRDFEVRRKLFGVVVREDDAIALDGGPASHPRREWDFAGVRHFDTGSAAVIAPAMKRTLQGVAGDGAALPEMRA